MAMEPKEEMETLAFDSSSNPSPESEKCTGGGSGEGATVAELERRIELLAEEKLQTRKRLEEEMKLVACERDALREELKKKKDEAEALLNEVVEFERINDECLLELKELSLQNRGLAQEKTAYKRRFHSIMVEAKRCLEERLRRNARRTQMFIERALATLQSSIDLMGAGEEDEGDKEEEEEDENSEVTDQELEEMEEEIIMFQRYESKLKAMERALKKRQAKREA